MTGAGFGGCTVSIVKTEDIDNFIAKVGAAYKEKIGYAADFYVVDIGDGAGVLKIKNKKLDRQQGGSYSDQREYCKTGKIWRKCRSCFGTG